MKSKEEVLNAEFVKDKTPDYNDEYIFRAMDTYADLRLAEYKERLKAEVYKAMHDGVLKYGVRVKPGAADICKLIDTL